MTEAGRERLRGIERSDSVVLDPHKSLFLPWGRTHRKTIDLALRLLREQVAAL